MSKQKYDELFKQVTSVFEKDGPDAGFSYIEDCIKKEPNSPEVYIISGEFYLETGDVEGALKDFENAIKIDPNEPQAYYDRGLLYAKTGSDINKAINDFSKAIELDANYAMAYANRGNMYLKLREIQKAISDCTKAIELSPDNFEPYFNRGLAYMNMKEFAKALEDYNKVIELAPENAEAYAKCGFLHQQLGNAQDAIRNYEKFLELDPNNKNATLIRDALSDLKSGKISSEDTLFSTETKRPSIIPRIIIMAVGAIIGGAIGGAIAESNYTETWIGILIGAFFGIGLFEFAKDIAKDIPKLLFENIGEYIKLSIKEEQAKRADKTEGCLLGLFYGLLWWAIIGFFKLCGVLIISPFVLIISPFIAISKCLLVISLYSPRVRKFTEFCRVRKFTEFWLGTDAFKNYKTETAPSPAAPSSSTNISDTTDKEVKPSSKKGLFIAISIVLGATVVALILYSLPTQTKNSKPNNNSMSEIDISDSRDSKAAEAKAAAKASVKSFTDSRDGKAYKTVTIGKQTWMAENLNYDTKGGKCHGDNPENCKKYGRLYNWTAAKKACPTGWHLPSNAEWDALYRLVDGTNGEQSPYKSETAGKYLKAKSGWNSQNEKSGNGEDAYSFAALPGGSGRAGTFHLLGDNGYWWSSTESDKDAYYRFMLYESDVAGWNSKSKSLLLSVRCVQD